MARTKEEGRKESANSSAAGSGSGTAESRGDAGKGVVAKRTGTGNKKDKPPVKAPVKRSRALGAKWEVIQKSRQFLREVKIELKKVTWPTRKEAIGTTGVVLVLVGIISLYLGLVDAGLTKALTVVMR